MSDRTKKRALLVTVGLIFAGVAVALLPTIASSGDAGPRELRMVVRDMTFYLEGNPAPNPTIVLRAGEQVRLHVRNDDAGMRHDFAVKAWTVGTRLLEDRGEEDTVTFTVPDRPGSATYVCTPHPKMMSGTLRVE